MRVRIRGIYATALTRLLLDAGHDVVGASGPIRERFDADFERDAHDIAVDTTSDRQGVGVVGSVEGCDAVVDDLVVARDTFAWASTTPPGSVFDAQVTETLGRGAVCSLGDGEGFLPFDAVDGHVETGDCLRVQVVEDQPPWADRRPELAAGLRADVGMVRLVAGRDGVTVDTRDEAAARELAGMTDFLDVDVPEGWGIEWTHAATEAGMDALDGALSRAVERAAALEEMRKAPVGDPGRRTATNAAHWLWFGRESRFALDDRRREVTTTMPGHHRTKAASESASAGVDLVEALCSPSEDGTFPFDVVTRQFGPLEGDRVAIAHGKPDGRLIVLGRGEVTDRDADGTLSLRRTLSGGGSYDALGVRRAAGDVAVTTVREGRWWYPTVYRSADGERKGTYVNVCTPVECFPDAVRYVDLHVDVVKHRDGTVERVDDDELDAAVSSGDVSEALAEKARTVASSIEKAL